MKTAKIRLALVGADTLLGRELKSVLEADKNIIIDSFAANGEPNFGEEEGEAVYREALTAELLKETAVVVSAGSAEGADKALQIARTRGGSLKLIDCNGHLDQQPEARIYVSGGEPSFLLVLPQPAASILASVLRRLAQYQPIVRAVVEIFEPASERGQAGISELQQQTTGLLSFRQLEKKVFDAQLSFNMLPAYGEKAPQLLESVEQRVETHLATLIANASQTQPQIPMPSLRLIQAPVFHGYTISAWVEFEQMAEAQRITDVLESDSAIDLRTAEHEMPTNVGAAGQSGISVGDLRVDRNNARAVWLWVVADNLRIVADQVNDLVKEWQKKA
jgi:aspartate-semialdehyde dehydrogenase